MKKTVLAVIMLVLSVSLPVFAADDTVLAKVGDLKITVSDFNRFIGYYDAERQKALVENPAYRVTILQRIVQGIVIEKIAKEKGFDQRPDIREQVTSLARDFVATEYVKKEVIEKIVVKEEDAQLYYKTHQEEFKAPETVRARHILIRLAKPADEQDKKDARTKAGEILKRIKAGEDFATLASKVSEDPGSKNKGGDLGFFPKGRMMPEFEKIAFSLKPGEVSDIMVETPFGFHIIKVEERKEAGLETYETAKAKAKGKVFDELRKAKVQEFVEKAMKDAGAEVNLEYFMKKQ